MKVEDVKDKRVLVTKLGPSATGPENHPNGIDQGYQSVGTLNTLEIGESMNVSSFSRYFRTSEVEDIMEREDHLIVLTRNSTYKVQLLPKTKPQTID